MPDDALPFGKDAKPDYPEPAPRRKLTPSEKEIVRNRQGGKCACCGIVPKAWEFDHVTANWTGQCDQSDLNEWQGLGSRNDCRCHAIKSGAEAKHRAKMNRIRGRAGQLARRKERGSLIPKPKISGLSKNSPGYKAPKWNSRKFETRKA